MGARSKTIHAARKKAEKMKAKAARRAQYEGFAANSKRRKRDASVKGTAEHVHCGNPACKKCFPEFHKRLKETAA